MASLRITQTPTYDDQTKNQRDIITQAVISVGFGLAAFLAFCFLRPRWTGLYAARKQQKSAASRLPELPGTFFGWIPVLYRITEEEVLAAAGLDAFVFLSFFKMGTKFLAITFFFSLVVIQPIHVHFRGNGSSESVHNDTNGTGTAQYQIHTKPTLLNDIHLDGSKKPDSQFSLPPTSFLWMYVVFVYLFTGVALYLIVTETKKIIRIRQGYLGNQSTITDRTIRLSGIPSELRSEDKIKETIEKLEIGKVESVMLCRDWKELDDLMDKRMNVLRKLEEAWTVHLGHKPGSKNRKYVHSRSSQSAGRVDGDDEESRLLEDGRDEQNHVSSYAHDRPIIRIWYGFLSLQNRRVDAIDYYEEKLRKLDEQIKSARKKDYTPTPLAFVTMDSIAACQMAVQATMDPEPMQLLAKPAPAPSDVIWQNTYLPRSQRMLRSWSITVLIIFLTVFWSVVLAPLAGLLSLSTIRKVWPQLADALESHAFSKTLVTSVLPTLIISLLNVAVPYLYMWFANLQGMISLGEVEMSLISKNFFFTFFNLFLVFTVFGTASKAIDLSTGLKNGFKDISDSFQNTARIAQILAASLQGLAPFYINLIILQGLGLFPFRLLEFGSVALYPIYLIGAKTPRDYAELVQPPVFSYGFYLPQTILIFVICTVYSVLQDSWKMLLFGLLYFLIGNFTYKYQLLYAMDHRQHSTGKAWTIICNRVVVGILVFQIAMAGVLALKTAILRSLLILPLLVGTIWFMIYYRRSYEPLMQFIALRSLHRDDIPGAVTPGDSRYDSETSHGRDVDEDEETGLRFINPSLIIPLEDMWIAKEPANGGSGDGHQEGDDNA